MKLETIVQWKKLQFVVYLMIHKTSTESQYFLQCTDILSSLDTCNQSSLDTQSSLDIESSLYTQSSLGFIVQMYITLWELDHTRFSDFKTEPILIPAGTL